MSKVEAWKCFLTFSIYYVRRRDSILFGKLLCACMNDTGLTMEEFIKTFIKSILPKNVKACFSIEMHSFSRNLDLLKLTLQTPCAV